jgi:hypothetical protein
MTMSHKVFLIQEEKKVFISASILHWIYSSSMVMYMARSQYTPVQYYLQHYYHDIFHYVHCATGLKMNTHCSNKSFSYVNWNWPTCMHVNLYSCRISCITPFSLTWKVNKIVGIYVAIILRILQFNTYSYTLLF